MRFISALWLNMLNNKTGKELLEKFGLQHHLPWLSKDSCAWDVWGISKPRGTQGSCKNGQVKHEMHFCQVTSTPAPAPLCLASGTGILDCEGEDDFAAAVLYNVLCTAIYNLHKAMERGAHSEPTDPIHSGGGIKMSFLHAGSG